MDDRVIPPFDITYDADAVRTTDESLVFPVRLVDHRGQVIETFDFEYPRGKPLGTQTFVDTLRAYAFAAIKAGPALRSAEGSRAGSAKGGRAPKRYYGLDVWLQRDVNPADDWETLWNRLSDDDAIATEVPTEIDTFLLWREGDRLFEKAGSTNKRTRKNGIGKRTFRDYYVTPARKNRQSSG